MRVIQYTSIFNPSISLVRAATIIEKLVGFTLTVFGIRGTYRPTAAISSNNFRDARDRMTVGLLAVLNRSQPVPLHINSWQIEQMPSFLLNFRALSLGSIGFSRLIWPRNSSNSIMNS